ncbi:MFS transporter [Sporolactobacillus vineae]|uniref:MFS transporter n=1 Tax=Sporolactobacillus vineae TaxID=444463 RepID=UPI00028894BA|nr:MFS transporter [Sporolactobacillus vineae]
MLSLFQNKNFRLLVSGRLLTNMGDSMYYVAAMWLVYQLGGSAFYSGLAGFLILLPQALQFLVGPVVDSHSIKNILMFSQLTQAVLLLLIPIAYFSGVLTVWLVLTVMLIVSFLDQFSFPAENALIPSILQREERTEANSVMALAYQGTDAAFNAVGGVILALVGAVSLYLADIGTFILAAGLFKSLKLSAEVQAARRKSSLTDDLYHYFTDLKAGFQVVLHSVLGKVIVTGVFTNFTLGAEFAVLPAYAHSLGGPRVYGFLLAGSAIGSLAGALLAPLFSRYAIGRVLAGSYFLGFCFWLLTYALPDEFLKVVFFSLSMIPLGLNNVIGYTLMQNVLPRKLIARSMSVMVSVSTCIMPLGSLIGGLAASAIGSGTVFLLASCGFLFVAVYVMSIPVLRRLPAAEKVRPEDYGFDAKTE